MLFPFKNAKLCQFMPDYFQHERKQRDYVATKIAHALEGHNTNLEAEMLCKEKSGAEIKVKASLLIQQHRDNVIEPGQGV